MQHIREPAVAGLFYPASPAALAEDVRTLLQAAEPALDAALPKALIVPHAGYPFSGAMAAAAYAPLSAHADRITRVVLLGPAHRVPVRGLALPGVEGFATPLGTVPLDREAIQSALALKQVGISAAAHAGEHALEVQLPFLQSVLGAFQLVPLLVGDASAEDVADVLERLWGGPETLIVISSDLSHFLRYEEANAVDRDTVDRILSLQPLHSHHQACGATPINALLLSARHRHLQPQLIGLCNSGDTAGDKNRVVGYASFAFREEAGHD